MQKTLMTDQDLKDAQPFADKIIEMTTNMRGPTAVAGIALALAAATHLAECGPDAARTLFDRFWGDLARAAAPSPPKNDITRKR